MNELIRIVLHLPAQASTFAVSLDQLHFAVIALTFVGAFGVTAIILTFVVQHHETHGTPRSAPRGIPKKLELGLIGGLLALFLGLWIVGYRQYVAMATPPTDSFDVYVIGKQWMWSFAYADGGASNHDLYVPVGKPVRLLLTSRDVIHSFFVPAMRIKQDAVPGRMTTAWFEASMPGVYDVLCSEYCGLSHSHMRGRVVVLPVEEYERFRNADQEAPESTVDPKLAGTGLPTPGESLATEGQRIAAERGCLRCHTLDGTPHLGPTWAGLFESTVPLEGGRSARADAEYLTRAMMDPNVEIHAGFAPIMPSYMGLLEAPEVAALVALIRTLRERALSDGPVVPLATPTPSLPVLPARDGGMAIPQRSE